MRKESECVKFEVDFAKRGKNRMSVCEQYHLAVLLFCTFYIHCHLIILCFDHFFFLFGVNESIEIHNFVKFVHPRTLLLYQDF